MSNELEIKKYLALKSKVETIKREVAAIVKALSYHNSWKLSKGVQMCYLGVMLKNY